MAKAHVLALEKSNLACKRLILANDKFSTQDILDNINKNFPQLTGKIAKGVPAHGLKVCQYIATVDNSKSKNLLGFGFRSFESAVNDTVSQILRARTT